MRKTIGVAAVALLLGLWTASAQAVGLELTSSEDVIAPGDWVEVTVAVTNETAEKDIVHIDFDLFVEVAGQTVFTGSAKRRLKLAAGETVEETIGTEVPLTPLAVEADVTVDATAKGRRSKTEDSASVFMTLLP